MTGNDPSSKAESMSKDGAGKEIYVYVWFDVEDYVTPESNDISLRVLHIMKNYHVPVTVKLVAEKIRFMKNLRRDDLIADLKRYCDIGYHTDTHSRHPVVYEYVRKMNVLKGSANIERRERGGMEELRRTFGFRPSCFGHAGSQWCPHYYPYLKRAGVEVYLDATDVVNINDSPYWYCGVLNLNNARKNYIRFDRTFEKPDGASKLKKRFETIRKRLTHQKGGAISILWHPHTAINKVYWDALNFTDGKNTPRGKYTLPERYPPEVERRAMRDFDELIKFASSFKSVRFISAKEGLGIYKRKLDMTLSVAQIERIARAVSHSKGRIGFFKLGDEYVSPAQVFCCLVNFVASFSRSASVPRRTMMNEPLGPMLPFRSRPRTKNFSLTGLLSSSEKVSKSLAGEGCIPSSIKIGHDVIGPSDYLATLAPIVTLLIMGRATSNTTVPLRHATMVLGEKYVNSAAFKRACEWEILPRGFKAPKILEQARLQAWTLVPAVARRQPST